jgi:hypothetical protein
MKLENAVAKNRKRHMPQQVKLRSTPNKYAE